MPERLALSYVLPLAAASPQLELTPYLTELAAHVEVVVVDGSPPDVHAAHVAAWSPHARVLALPPGRRTPMGKVGNVLVGIEAAGHDKVVIGDDDVRWTPAQLAHAAALLDEAEVVRPQNWFDPAPWHARWDTGRALLNRMTGGDWPGTMAVRRSAVLAAGGYAGDVMFENLELVRTVEAAGGRELVAFDLLVRRLPPTTRHFLRQRVRQAYDELARPARLLPQLALLPAALRCRGRFVAPAAVAAVAVAEAGRRRAGGTAVFPPTAALWAPAWLAERAVTSWLALGARARGGVRYRDVRLRRAATPVAELRARAADWAPAAAGAALVTGR